MDSLELKVPPDLVVVILAAAMWGVSLFTPQIQLQSVARVLAAATIALVGAVFTIAGIVSFRRAKTTVSPLHPEVELQPLVSSGVYTITRNPSLYVWAPVPARRMGGLSLLAIGTSGPAGLLSVHRSVPNRARRTRALQSVPQRLHQLPSKGSSMVVRPNYSLKRTAANRCGVN